MSDYYGPISMRLHRLEKDADKNSRIEELEAGILAVATELLPRIENGLDLGEGYTMLRHLAEAIPRQALGDNDE